MCAHCVMRLTATGACAPAWLAATSTHIDAAAPMPASGDARTVAAVARRRGERPRSRRRPSAQRSAGSPPSPTTSRTPTPRLTPAASRSASTTPATPSAADDPRASARVRRTGRPHANATRHVDAMPTMPIKPTKNNHRLTDREKRRRRRHHRPRACALALVADSPTPNAYAPVARWPSISETVFQVTVYTPCTDGFQRHLELEWMCRHRDGWTGVDAHPGTVDDGDARETRIGRFPEGDLDKRGCGLHLGIPRRNRTLRKGMCGHCRRQRKSCRRRRAPRRSRWHARIRTITRSGVATR